MLFIMLHNVMLSVAFLNCCAECSYAEHNYDEYCIFKFLCWVLLGWTSLC